MDRELLFRVWDGKELSYDVLIYDGEVHRGWRNFEDGIQFTGPVMQYTGYKDDTGKEIYEGDVVRFTTGREDSKVFIGVVEFYQGCFALCFEFPLGGRYINTGWVGSLNTVLGNMYENPELLSQCGELVK